MYLKHHVSIDKKAHEENVWDEGSRIYGPKYNGISVPNKINVLFPEECFIS